MYFYKYLHTDIETHTHIDLKWKVICYFWKIKYNTCDNNLKYHVGSYIYIDWGGCTWDGDMLFTVYDQTVWEQLFEDAVSNLS